MIHARGRRPTFDAKTRRYFAKLIGQRGLVGALEHTVIPVSAGTLLKIAKEFEIKLPRGRRPLSASPVSSPKLKRIQKQRLQQILCGSAQLHGYNSDVWTLRRVAEIVERFIAVKCRSCDAKPLVESMGFAVKRAGALRPLSKGGQRPKERTLPESWGPLDMLNAAGAVVGPGYRMHVCAKSSAPGCTLASILE